MRRLTLIFALLFPAPVMAQNPTVIFTLGAPYNNYIPVLTENGVATSGTWYVDYVYDCALTTVVCSGGPQHAVSIAMPDDPVNPGQRFFAGCTGVVTSNTVPAYSKSTQQPPGSLQSYETCTVTEPWYTATWTGTLTYNYVSVLQRHCSSGRAGGCVTAYYPVFAGGSGSLSTTPPPPPPPPPVVTVIPIGSGVCLASVVCSVEPATQDVITGVTIDLTNALIGISNADGSTLTGTVDSWNLTPTGDDESDTYVLSVQGTLYNADGSTFGTYDAELTGQLTDSGSLVITSGTLTETQ
jgi:hypothetical protein